MLMRSVDTYATVAPCHTQHAAVMHGSQQMRRRVRGTAPIVSDRAVREIIIHFAGVHITALPNKLQQKLCPLFLSIRPGLAFGRHTSIRTRMHQSLYRSREKTVDDKEILFDSELWVKAF